MSIEAEYPQGGWAAARQRLAEAADRLDRGPSPEEVTERLRARTAALAATPEEPDPQRDVVVFGRGAERYALEVTEAVGVVPVMDLVVLPELDPLHLGVFVHRGAAWTLIDLNVLLDRPGERSAAAGFAVLVEHPGCAIGLAADAVLGVRSESAHRLDAAPRHHAVVLTVLPDGTNLIALQALTGNARLVVDDRMRAT